MIQILSSENIFLDSNSQWKKWDKQCEKLFIEKFFEFLKIELREDFNNYIFYIFNSDAKRKVILPASTDINHPNKILIYLSDEWSTVPEDLQKYYLVIFKCYLPYEISQSNIFPFPLGYVSEVPEYKIMPLEYRSIDIFFSGNLNSSRVQLYQALHPILRFLPRIPSDFVNRAIVFFLRKTNLINKIKLDLSSSIGTHSFLKFTNGFRTGLNPKKYGALLYSSKVVLCPKGFVNTETYRHYEAMRAGAIVISEKLPDTFFYRNAPFVKIKNWKEGIYMAKQLLNDPEALNDLHLKHLKHYESICSEKAVASYVAKILTRHRLKINY